MEKAKKNAEERARVMKEAQERLANVIAGPKSPEEDPFSMLKKKPKIKVEVE